MFRIIAKNVLTALATFMVLAACFFWFYQHDLIHHPALYSLDELKIKYSEADMELWPGPENYRGLIAVPEGPGPVAGTVVIFHGNAGSVVDKTWMAHDLANLGYRVILHEYPSYGARRGDRDEQSLIEDAASTLLLARSENPEKLYVIGDGLGSAIAVGAVVTASVDGMMLISPWKNLADVAKQIYWYMPVDLILRERYDNVERIKGYTGPLVAVWGDKDKLIDPAFSRALYDGYVGPKKSFVVPGAGHNDWKSIATPEFWRETMGFLSRGE